MALTYYIYIYMTQTDMLNMVGNNPSTTTVFTPHVKGGSSQLDSLIRDGIMQGSKVSASPSAEQQGGRRMSRS